ncbi:GAF domain-containing protein [Streptomyces aidingensis]|uniref:GAF domain-containing protein n=1 Tax=Streptomyces aidingensis TaxID=910347 RepID=A0A1I1JDU7_9ACTN|nr:GAF domain-containing protein [Streptomyces aidingensis]SFC46779.1 GAF domain-containing protein [Streptomyces aidingensis]
MATSYDPTSHLLLTPEDRDAPARMMRFRELGLGDRPVAEFDAFARRLAELTGAPFAVVNLVGEDHQYFAGLYATGSEQAVELGPNEPAGGMDRMMDRDHGYCPHVVVRKKALVLEDVCDYPRFAGNPVVDELGIRSYLGAPLLDPSGIALGTVCVVDQEPRPWGRQGLETIKAMAAELAATIQRGIAVPH